MALSIFDSKTVIPTEQNITNVLEETKSLWDTVKAQVNEQCGMITETWKFYSKSSGWTSVVKYKKRTILYLYPCQGYFIVLFVFGERAVNAVKNSHLPSTIVDTILAARVYSEGRSFQVEVRTPRDLEIIQQLIQIKHDN